MRLGRPVSDATHLASKQMVSVPLFHPSNQSLETRGNLGKVHGQAALHRAWPRSNAVLRWFFCGQVPRTPTQARRGGEGPEAEGAGVQGIPRRRRSSIGTLYRVLGCTLASFRTTCRRHATRSHAEILDRTAVCAPCPRAHSKASREPDCKLPFLWKIGLALNRYMR